MRSSLRRWSVVAFLLANSLVLGAHTYRPEAVPSTFLAVVSSDGLLLPIAAYDGETWWNRWPWGDDREKIRSLPVPPTLREIPEAWLPPGMTLPSEWRFQSQSGAVRNVHAIRPARLPEAPTTSTIGLQSDLRVSKRDREREEELGLAIAGDGQLGRVMSPSPAEAARILAVLAPKAQDLERAELDRWWRESGKPGPVNLVLDKNSGAGPPGLLRAGTSPEGARYYDLSGDRVYRIPGEECGVHLSINGLVIAGPDGRIVFENMSAGAFGEYCGDAGESVYLLGTVIIRGHIYWINKIVLEDGYDYELYDPERRDFFELKGASERPIPR